MSFYKCFLVASIAIFSHLSLFALPDLEVLQVSAQNPTVPPPGNAPVEVEFVIRNRGDQNAVAFRVGVYSAQAQSCSVTQGERLLDTADYLNLGPGQMFTASFSLAPVPGDTIIYGRVKVDILNQVTESNENNNCRSSFAITVLYPDLRVIATSGPNPNKFIPGEAGAPLTTSIRNFTSGGNGWFAGFSTTGHYLSVENSNPPETDRIDGLDNPAPEIDPNETVDQTLDIAFPEDTPLGDYNLFAKADANNQVIEGNRENNNFSAPIAVRLVDICEFTDFNESGSVDILDLINVVNNVGQPVTNTNNQFNIKKSHAPFPELINTVDLLAAIGCWGGFLEIGAEGTLHDFTVVPTLRGHALSVELSGAVSSIETMIALPAGSDFGSVKDVYDTLSSNFVTSTEFRKQANALYSNNSFLSIFQASTDLQRANYYTTIFDTMQGFDWTQLKPLSPGETFQTGIAVQVVFESGRVVMMQKKLDYLHVPDANLRAVLQAKLGLPTGVPIPAAEALNVVELDLDNENISDLTGLEKCTNLVFLTAANNALTELPAIGDFQSLRSLNLANNNFAAFPAKLPASLESVSFANNRIRSFPATFHMTNLHTLDISGNSITALPSLQSMSRLETLVCRDNELMALPSFAASLRNLDASFNNLIGLPAFSGMLVDVDVRDNYISDVSSLLGHVNLQTQALRLDNNNLDANFCGDRDALLIALGGKKSNAIFTYENQLLPFEKCLAVALGR